jgi:hypothetical protein
MRAPHADLLIALNERRRAIVVTLEVELAPEGALSLSWNGAALACARARGSTVATALDLRRGVNVLGLDAPSGTRLRLLRLEAASD